MPASIRRAKTCRDTVGDRSRARIVCCVGCDTVGAENVRLEVWMRALIFGAAGMLGSDLSATAPPGTALTALDIGDVDITNRSAVAAALRDAGPDWVINAAAYTAVDRAETERALAEAVNGVAPGHIAGEAARQRIPVVHFSTDYVFDGTATAPYREDDPVAPVNEYGATKLHGEQAVLASGTDALVLRTQWLFGRAGKSFPRTMWERANAGLSTRVVSDQFGRPTYTRDLAVATWQLVERRASGIVHVTNSGAATTWFELAREVFKRAGAESLLSPCATEDYPTPARRPAYSVLGTDRLERILPAPLPDWRDGLERFLDELSEASS
jgi:dTDP-4-dehydrorhamnose reductase